MPWRGMCQYPYVLNRNEAVLDSSTKLDNREALDETETFGKKKAF